MGIFIFIVKRLVQAIRLFFEIVGIAQIVLWLIGGGVVTSGVIAWLKDLPIVVPIAVLVIGVGALAYSIIRTVHRYRLWNKLGDSPELNDVMQKALDIHFRVRDLHDTVIKENRRKNIKTTLRTALAKKYLATAGISLKDLAMGFNPDGTFTKKLYRKIRRFYGLQEGNYFTALPHLKNYGRVLDKAKLGLRASIRADAQYQQLQNEFMKLQLQLNVPSQAIDYINNLPELSYGLYSASVGANLAHAGRSWYGNVPDSWIKQQEEAESTINEAYLKATAWAKNRVRRAIFGEAVSG